MTSSAPHPLSPTPSPLRGWVELILLSIRRQARMREMVWVALGLLGVATLFIGLNTRAGSWNLIDRRARPLGITYRETLHKLTGLEVVLGRSEPATAIHLAVLGAARATLDESAFFVFSRWVVFAIFQSFLLPIWTLSFATDALGNERESGTLIWLFTRSLPRWSIYLAKWLSALPWCLGMNLVGFAAICLAAGAPGRQALGLFWPAVVWGTLAFSALFQLVAAVFRRPAVVGLIYAFFFETLVSDLPGDLKRMSLNFYVRSLMYDSVSDLGVDPNSLTVYSPVAGETARAILIGATVVFSLIGMWIFSRREFREDV